MQVETRYQNVVVDGDRISGESMTSWPNMPRSLSTWSKFVGNAALMRIRAAVDSGDRVVNNQIWKLQDGYGAPGTTPAQGWDWSGIRDSSEQAIARMDAVAKEFWGNKQWPWEV